MALPHPPQVALTHPPHVDLTHPPHVVLPHPPHAALPHPPQVAWLTLLMQSYPILFTWGQQRHAALL